MKYGHSDSSIPAEVMAAHAAAITRGDADYVDPLSGYRVMTSKRLLALGSCCASGCRHCPYSADEQRRAGRSWIRPPEPS
ncbi:MAG: hypothetical protein ACI841_004489 [Planctomycetota bacterium]|jgi:hypothetical protein